MSLRVTPRTAMRTAMEGLNASLDRTTTLQEQLSSSRQINRPSDSPIGTVSAMQMRSDIRRADQFGRNANDGLSWLGIADNTLTAMNDTIGRVRELTIQGMNASMDAGSRANIAAEITTLRDTLVGQANAKYLDRPIFAGNAGSVLAYDPTTTTFSGSAGDLIERRVAPNLKVRVNLTGPEIFGPDGAGAAGNLFQVVNQIATDLVSNPSALGTDLNALDARSSSLQNRLGEVGAKYNQVEGMKSRADDQMTALQGSLSDIENVDLPKTITDLQLQDVAYQAALAATAKVIQPSLVDFLR
jgi:flagellar hook-associated protein 3 FlgL